MFDQKTILGLVAAALILAGAVFGFSGDGGSDRATAPTAQTSERAPSTAEPPPTDAARKPELAEQDFDYYVLVLSWSPTHCASDRGRGAEDDEQCRSGRPFGFVLHGLWPQHERGYPQNCPTEEPRELNPAIIGRMMEFSPSEQLLQHEWEKHGTCSGLSQRGYFAAAEQAFTAVTIPSGYEQLNRVMRTTPDKVRDDFLKANRDLTSDSVAATCSRNEFAEIWICLDKALSPRACSNDVAKRHCGDREVRMRAVRGDWPR